MFWVLARREGTLTCCGLVSEEYGDERYYKLQCKRCLKDMNEGVWFKIRGLSRVCLNLHILTL